MNKTDLVSMINKTIQELEVLIDYVKKNPHKAWCRGINIKDCEFKLKYSKAALKDAIWADLPF